MSELRMKIMFSKHNCANEIQKRKLKSLKYPTLYLKFGAEAHSRAKQARFTAA